MEYKRIVVKVGSNVLSKKDGNLDITRMSAIVDQLSELHAKGMEVMLVTSGAVAAGRAELNNLDMDSVQNKQLQAAVGQAKLIEHYYRFFKEYGIVSGQILTTKENFEQPELMANQKRCMDTMLASGVIPVINENDVVAIKELMFTDNDELSVLVSEMMNADLLIILTNVDGIYDKDPGLADARVIPEINLEQDYSGCISEIRSSLGRGGMQSKMVNARHLAQQGIPVYIANGKKENILINLLYNAENTVFTKFLPKTKQI